MLRKRIKVASEKILAGQARHEPHGLGPFSLYFHLKNMIGLEAIYKTHMRTTLPYVILFFFFFLSVRNTFQIRNNKGAYNYGDFFFA